ncbi:hypothetical protein BDZ89DRAFT_1056596 [Hymenopellis radicata]|nr:hypothetical protein BDZ89DRAFT_1056596 [Hymenopellis radicata]
MSYSEFFSSGLLAPRFTPSLTPSSLDTAYEDCSDIDVDTDREITPTPTPSSKSSQSSLNSNNPANAGPVQRLRKRRSSVSLAQSPVKAIKAVPRGLLNSPARSRSGSVGTNMNKATEGTSLIGRMRSGSVGTALRPQQRKLRAHAPALPPPAMPLPALPKKFQVVPIIRQPLAPIRGEDCAMQEN